MTSIIAVTCENRKGLVMGCDSLLIYESNDYGYRINVKEDKIYEIGNFLFGAPGDADLINEALRMFENNIPADIQSVYQELLDFDRGMNFLLCGEDRGKMAVYRYEKEAPTTCYSVGVGRNIVEYNFFSVKYHESMPLKQSILFILDCLNDLEKFLAVERPFHIHYFDDINSNPEKLDETILNEFQELVYEKKKRENMIGRDMERRVEEIKL